MVVVFVIVDSVNDVANGSATSQGRSSILTMNRVRYETDAHGKMDLKMERYLDTFPFDNFVIVQDIQSLPHVLSATLRQWGERVNAT